ncbi:MAG: nicotinate-nucleotide adenylyltransferase [Nitrospira sp.]|nr:nicotinate-nucleotide adenylyltransferase [Nitrospira sp.]
MSDSPLTRIGLLGGTFDPVHNCHLWIAGQAQRALSLDRVIFIPSGAPPHKSRDSLAPARHRLRMVQHAVAGLAGFTVSDVEANAPETSYTIDTIRTLRETVKGELWFIIGLDAFLEIAGWKSAETLLTLTNFLVLSRPHVPFTRTASLGLLPPLPAAQLQHLDDGRQQRLDLPIGPRARITFLRIDPCEASSSDVRERIRKGADVTDWLPPPVHSYIIEHNLYVPR